MKHLILLSIITFLNVSCSNFTTTGVLNSSVDNYGQNSITKFKYKGTLALASLNNKNILFSEMLTLAKTTYGSNVTINNIRTQNNYRKFIGFNLPNKQQVIFDVYEGH